MPALLSRNPPLRRQAEAGWGAVKRSHRWEPVLHPHSPDSFAAPNRRRQIQPARLAGAVGAAESLELYPTEQVSTSR